MSKLNNLHRSHQPINALIIQTRVSGSNESSFQVRAPSLLHAEDAGARLVEHFHERDVEVCYVGAEGEVDGCEGVLVRTVDHGGAARGGPHGA